MGEEDRGMDAERRRRIIFIERVVHGVSVRTAREEGGIRHQVFNGGNHPVWERLVPFGGASVRRARIQAARAFGADEELRVRRREGVEVCPGGGAGIGASFADRLATQEVEPNESGDIRRIGQIAVALWRLVPGRVRSGDSPAL